MKFVFSFSAIVKTIVVKQGKEKIDDNALFKDVFIKNGCELYAFDSFAPNHRNKRAFFNRSTRTDAGGSITLRQGEWVEEFCNYLDTEFVEKTCVENLKSFLKNKSAIPITKDSCVFTQILEDESIDKALGFTPSANKEIVNYIQNKRTDDPYGALLYMLITSIIPTDSNDVDREGQTFAPKSDFRPRLLAFYERIDKSSSGCFQEKVFRKQYYETLWRNHHKGRIRDQVATGKVRELVDFYAIPTFIKRTGLQEQQILEPFSKEKLLYFISADSGMGKSTLLHMLILCTLFHRFDTEMDYEFTETIRKKTNQYTSIKNSLLGNSPREIFPIYIDSDKANEVGYKSVLDLAEARDQEGFDTLLRLAKEKGEILFLIDSVDEVESNKLSDFIVDIGKMLSEYDNANFIIVSRSLGTRQLPFECEKIELNGLVDSDVEAITKSVLSDDTAKRFLARLEHDNYLKILVKNPFMLMTILETKGNPYIHQKLRSIVSAIIDRRWEKYHQKMEPDDIELLLGYLACNFVFGNKQSAELTEIRQYFNKMKTNLKLNGISYDYPGENIAYFLNTLSCQSGILVVRDFDCHNKYSFQDALVKCWLAANYIKCIISETDGIQDRNNDATGIWKNLQWLDSFVRLFNQDAVLSCDSVTVLVMTLVMVSDRTVQNGILYYLLCRDATSTDKIEKENIAVGYMDILNNTLGVNNITNMSNDNSRILITQMLSDE